MVLLNLLLFICSLWGIKAACYYILEKNLFRDDFVYFLSWFLALGIIGLVSSLGYYLNLAFFLSRGLLLVGGICGLSFFGKRHWQRSREILASFKWPTSGGEKFYLCLMILFLLNYFYRSLIPWFDQDEISQYGLYTKLIANNWGRTDLFRFTNDGNMKFAEALYAQAFAVFHHTIFVRILKWFNLLALLGLTFSFLRKIGTDGRVGSLALCLFLGTPELSYLATSLKVDSTTMIFEWCSYLLVLTAFLEAKKSFLPSSSKILAAAVIFNYMATATRPSGAYAAIFFTLLYLGTFIKNKKIHWPSLGLVGAAALAFSHPYLSHILTLGNPIFPFKAPWPFDQGLYQFGMEKWQQICNLPQFIPPPFYQFYLLIHVAMGMETALFKMFTFIPHAQDKGISLGQLSPTLLLLFAAPLWWKKDKLVKAISFIFWPLFFLWSLGVQLTRVFLATGQLPILFAVRLGRKMEWALALLSCLLFCYQTLYSIMKYPHSPLTLVSAESRHEANQRVLQGHHTRFTHYVGLNEHEHWPNHPPLILSLDQVRAIESHLNRPLAKLLVLDSLFYGLHIHFKNVLVFQASTLSDGSIQLQVPSLDFGRPITLDDFTCVLRAFNDETAGKWKNFAKVAYQDEQIELLCQVGHDKSHEL